MSPELVFSVLSGYFALLLGVAFLTGRNASNAAFFTANKSAPWYVVSFGMIGASLSGVTFISVPGWVKASQFGYMQMVIGYLAGYVTIAYLLLPLYYKLELQSIYGYLHKRLGLWSYRTGSAFFILSKAIGAAFRLFVVVKVLQLTFFEHFGIPFVVTALVTLVLIWIYTARGGIKTIVWTDTLQTFFMLAALVMTFGLVAHKLDWSFTDAMQAVQAHDYSQIWNWDWTSKSFFGKQFVAGAFMSIVMTGLDQDMMQKNLSCKTLKESQKNVMWLSVALIPVNLMFLALGVVLYIYAEKMGIPLPKHSDDLFPTLATHYLGVLPGVVFLLGVIAAAFSSADSALTALTTAFCIDFLGFDRQESPEKLLWRKWVHVAFSFFLLGVIVIFHRQQDESVISAVFTAASYTYGPLLGLFAFGLFTRLGVREGFVPWIAVASPTLSYVLNSHSEAWFGGYVFGFEILIVNGLIMFLGLWLSSFFYRSERS